MTSRPPHCKLALGLALALALALMLEGPALAGTLPRLEADSMGGTHVVLPADAAGKPLVLLLAFTKEAEGDVKSWSRKLIDDRVGDRAAVYVVVVADRTSSFARKHVRKIVEGASVGTEDQKKNNVLITFDGTGWRDLTPPGDKNAAGIVVCNSGGSVVYAKRERFNAANLADVEQIAK